MARPLKYIIIISSLLIVGMLVITAAPLYWMLRNEYLQDAPWSNDEAAWDFFVSMQSRRIRMIEAEGEPPPGGSETWEDFWNIRFKHICREVDNPSVWIDKILELRRQEGLPEIEVRECRGEKSNGTNSE